MQVATIRELYDVYRLGQDKDFTVASEAHYRAMMLILQRCKPSPTPPPLTWEAHVIIDAVVALEAAEFLPRDQIWNLELYDFAKRLDRLADATNGKPQPSDPAKMLLLSKATTLFGFKWSKELTCFLDRHPEVVQDRPLTKRGTAHLRRRRVDVLALVKAVSRDDAIMSDPARKARMESRLQRAQLSKELEEKAIAFIAGETE